MKTTSTMKYSLILVISMLLIQACGSVPFTGRKQLLLVSDQEVIALSLQQYQDYMSTAKIERGTRNAEMVNRVGNRVKNAVETFLTNNGYGSEIQNYKWEFNLVQDPSVNAFAMPGGKVVVNTGLLPVTGDESALAVVVGHEIAHVIAKHSNERVSQQIALQYGGAIAGNVLGGSAGSQIGQTVFGLGAQMGVMLPYARKQELESDELGLIFMAMAGYDPRVSIPFWVRMSQNSEGGSVPEVLSTHPSDEKRIAKLQQLMPEVLKYYKGNGVQNTASTPIKTKADVPGPTEVKKAKTSEDWKF